MFIEAGRTTLDEGSSSLEWMAHMEDGGKNSCFSPACLLVLLTTSSALLLLPFLLLSFTNIRTQFLWPSNVDWRLLSRNPPAFSAGSGLLGICLGIQLLGLSNYMDLRCSSVQKATFRPPKLYQVSWSIKFPFNIYSSYQFCSSREP